VGGLKAGITNAGDGSCSIDEAIQAATTNGGSVDCGALPGAAAFLDTIIFQPDAASLTFNVQSALTGASATSGPLLIQGHTTGGATNLSGHDTYPILLNSGGDLSVKNASLNHGVSPQNTGCGGGAVLNFGTLTLDQVTVYNNSSVSQPLKASALCSLGPGSSVTITSSSFFNNFGNSGGNTIDIEAGANSISNTYIAENYTADTSGVAISGSGTTLTITNSTIVANSYDSGPFNQLLKVGANSQLTLLNDTLQIIYQEQAHPVLLFNAGTISTKNTIFASEGGSCGDGITTDTGNNLDTGDACDLNGNNGSLENADPRLDVPSGFGGTTVLPLLSGSDAIDTGTNSGCPPMDQRGGNRPLDGNSDGSMICDIGAYEVPGGFETPTGTPVVTGSPTPTPTPSPTPTATPSPTPGTVTPTPTASPTPTGPTATPIPNPTQGDVNCDGNVDEFDFGDLIGFAAGLNDGLEPEGCLNLTDPESNSGFGWGDVNCDTHVDALDALFVLEYTADLHTLVPAAQNCFPIGDVMT
ncbi:MAG: choice-of-anchor Q domain-containing protein, partial [Chloroflexota bacterium]